MAQAHVSKLSYFVRCCLHILGRCIGIKKDLREWRFDGLIMAGWVFVLGLPLGAMVVGSGFSIFLWALIVLLATLIVHADDAIHYLAWLQEYTLDGEVKNAN